MNFDESFWTKKYETGKTGWDMGEVSPPIKAYFDRVENKDLHILIPGGGNSYEAEYLFRQGFHNVYLLDIAVNPLDNLKHRAPDFPKENLLHQNFFDFEGCFDVIVEQTFFCAIPPSLRSDYAYKMASLLPKGKELKGVLFDFPLTEKGPPYGGSKTEYIAYFQPYFLIEQLSRCTTSHRSRENKELLIKLTRL